MNRESLKRHCEAICKKFKDIPTSGTYEEHRLVLELLEQTTWIPVSERLPEKNVWVLVTVVQGSGWYVEIMRIDKYKGMFTDNIDYYDSIIAWMPLPKPYEPQEISDQNLKMWHDIYEEEKRRERSDKE